MKDKSLVEKQVEVMAHEVGGDKAVQLMQAVSKLAAKQGGETMLENYQLLAKRALIAAGITVVAIQAVAGIVGHFTARKREEQRVEQIVRRILAEERARA